MVITETDDLSITGPRGSSRGASLGARMVASARRPVAAVAPRPEDRPRWRTGLVVGAPRHLDLRHRAGSAGDPGPSVRDFGDFLGSDRAEDFFRGAWGWFAVVVVLAVFNTVLGEELLFRGLLLLRMRVAFGRWDWVANRAVRGLPPAPAVGHSHLARGHLRSRLFLSEVPERLDGDHRALDPERRRRRPHPRTRLVGRRGLA